MGELQEPAGGMVGRVAGCQVVQVLPTDELQLCSHNVAELA